ncbi:MAG TPA: hypothetical protein PLO87_04330 [Ornithinibacter sp.]|nr:hypothetical protein [Ornithinibacter sp.]HQD67799.1 hypothetical protein [Ornithinibacter sp.]
MAEKLKIVGSTLDEGVLNIKAAKEAFESADKLTDEIVDAVGAFRGHQSGDVNHLGDLLRDASSSWSVHRKQLVETLDALGVQLIRCIKVFGDTDKELADGTKPK